MQYRNVEIANNDPSCKIILGNGSDGNYKAIKYGWPDKNGKIARGGEFPVSALPQMIKMALKYGDLTAEDIFK